MPWGSHHFTRGTYAEGVDLLRHLDSYVLTAIWIAGIPVGVYAFMHAMLQRAEAFTAANKLTKPAWLGITGVSALVLVLFQGPSTFLWLPGIIAVLVYLVDVRPRVTEVQRGPRW